MATVLTPPLAESGPDERRGTRVLVAIALAVWLLLVVSLGAAGTFVAVPGSPPVAIAAGVAVPLLLFAALLWLSSSFREFVQTLDLRLVAAMQAWRWAGLGFLALYAHNVLPAVFALPAGLGDMAVGAVAPWMVLSLARQPGFAASRAFVRWNLFGVLDLVVAITIATVSSMLASGTSGGISVAPMALLPLLVIPAFLVPLFLMLHAAALLQSRQLSRSLRLQAA